MAGRPDAGTDRRRERPKDRKQRIGEHAARLFTERGFHAVRMEDIAAADGITVRALYRHYAHKQALLAHVVRAGQDAYRAAFEAAAGPWPGPDCTDGLLAGLIGAATHSRGYAVLRRRESRYLLPEDRARVVGRLFGLVTRTAEQIGREPPAPGADAGFTAELRAWALVSALAGPAEQQVAAPRSELAGVLDAAARALLAVPVAVPAEATAPARALMASRRERVLAAAAAAFHRDGYPEVGTDDIGREAGIVGPALYRYFPTKLDILVTLCRRHDERSTLETSRALRAGSPREVLSGLVEGLVRLALEDPDLVAVGQTEVLHLPGTLAEQLLRNRSDRVAEWRGCLREVRPDLPAPAARVLVASAMAVVESVAQVPRVTRRGGVGRALVELATAVLLAPLPAPGCPAVRPRGGSGATRPGPRG
ncbi:TetR/AcrR family transcriptional regulator [Pseudonocardia humida]|uniref:TetR/AcrR family transcriptional regulator n=1 Tax=Pseudonocardia humida TaxID=2800819 RepID=A0ABT1A3A9_9PSEU|nr:TetR/AcrR family transcriptional regulator [Pseudonocardia humida]MCO1657490.1 TetR/AcrR family transcriptional regulator [Pseudonocardia humida]